MGPLITGEHRHKVRGYVDRGVAEGANLIVDGRELKIEGTSRASSSDRRCSIA